MASQVFLVSPLAGGSFFNVQTTFGESLDGPRRNFTATLS